MARSLHGIASACVAVSGMCLVADLYQNSTRSRIMGIVLGSVAMGVLFGYPLGGILYDFLGKTAPFIVIAVMLAGCIGNFYLKIYNFCFKICKIIIWLFVVLQICYLDITYYPQPNIKTPVTNSNNSWYELLLDPPVSIIFGAIWISTTAMSILEPCLPLWMMTNMNPTPEKWQLGTVFIPDSLGYLLGTNCTGFIAENIKKWKLALVSMLTVGICASLVRKLHFLLKVINQAENATFNTQIFESNKLHILEQEVEVFNLSRIYSRIIHI